MWEYKRDWNAREMKVSVRAKGLQVNRIRGLINRIGTKRFTSFSWSPPHPTYKVVKCIWHLIRLLKALNDNPYGSAQHSA